MDPQGFLSDGVTWVVPEGAEHYFQRLYDAAGLFDGFVLNHGFGFDQVSAEG